MHPTCLCELSHPGVNHRETGCTRLPALKFRFGLWSCVVSHGFESWFIVVIESVGISEKDVGIELPPGNLFSKYRVAVAFVKRS